jgi:regulator of protease activity HflC (stomatin/prohibitin superfamily)
MNAPLLVVIATSLALIGLSLKRVPQGQAYTVHRFGAYRRTLQPGLRWIFPLLESIAHRVRTTGHELRLTPQIVPVDGSPSIAGSVYFQVLDPARADEDADHLEEVVLDAMHGAIRELSASEVVDDRLNRDLKERSNRVLRSHGLAVVRCQLRVQQAA